VCVGQLVYVGQLVCVGQLVYVGQLVCVGQFHVRFAALNPLLPLDIFLIKDVLPAFSSHIAVCRPAHECHSGPR
jgi:hypothetical protein